jgi:hypothetical protein
MGMIDLKFDKLNYLETANFKHLSVSLCNIICFVKYCENTGGAENHQIIVNLSSG